jgi:uncharacterized protein DUF4124
MRALLFTLMWVCTIATAATVYKWVDENGVTHYSDQPHENAEKVQVKAPQTYTAAKIPATPPPSYGNVPQKPAGPAYQSCTIAQPTDDEVFMNTETVTAGVATQPPVRPGDTAIVTLDGQRLPGVPSTGGQFTISPIDRGTHSIQVTVQDSNGATVCSSKAVTFHVHQPSLLSPTQPAKPR